MMHTQVDPSGTTWLSNVRALAQAPVQVRAAHFDTAQVIPFRRTQGVGPFSGHEGCGCPLSQEERRIAARVGADPMSWERGQ